MLPKEEKAYALLLRELSDASYKKEMWFHSDGSFNSIWQTYINYRLQYKMFLLQQVIAKCGVNKNWNFQYFSVSRIYSESLYYFTRTACLCWNDIDVPLRPNIAEAVQLVNDCVAESEPPTLGGAKAEILGSACLLLYLFDTYWISYRDISKENYSVVYSIVNNSVNHSFVKLYKTMELADKIIKKLQLDKYIARYNGFMEYLYQRLQKEKTAIARLEAHAIPFISSKNIVERSGS